MTYGSQIWGQSINTYIDKVSIIQKNAVRIITFADFNAHTDPLLKKINILKIKDHVTLQNCLLVYDYINNKLPKSFNNTFVKLKDVLRFQLGMLTLVIYIYHFLILLDMD